MKRVAWLNLVLICSACGAPAESASGVLFAWAEDGSAPRYGKGPFPSDAFLRENGRLEPIIGLEAVVPEQTDNFRRHLMSLDGFGARPLVELFVSGPIDPAGLPARGASSEDPLFVIDVDPASPARGQVVAMDWRWDPIRLRIAGAPQIGVVLGEARRYALVATRALTGADGSPLARAEAFSDLLALADDEVPARWQSTKEALNGIVDDAELVGGSVFRTAHLSRSLHAGRALLDEPGAVPAPSIHFDDPALIFDSAQALDRVMGVATRDEQGRERWGWSNPTGMAHEHVGLIATGVLTAPSYLRPLDAEAGPDSETFALDEATGTPELIAPSVPIPVTLILPKAPPATSAGYPIAILGHGLGNSRHALLSFAEPLSEAGFALVAIDMVGHGARYNPKDRRNNTAELIPGFNGDPELADGFGDITGSITTFGLLRGFGNLSAVRDSMRQSVLDLSALLRAVTDPALDLSALSGAYAGVTPKLDPSRPAYLGESYGAVIGAVFAGVEPALDLFILDVPGSGIVDLEIASSPALYGPVLLLARSTYGFAGRFDRFHPAASLAQAMVDPADPLTFAPHVLERPKSVVLIEVLGDEVMANIGTRALAHAMGVPLLAPYAIAGEGLGVVESPARANLDNGQTAVMIQYGPASHGANWTSEAGVLEFEPGFPFDGDDPFPRRPAPVPIVNPLRETLTQVIETLKSHAEGGPPIVRSVLPPRLDYGQVLGQTL